MKRPVRTLLITLIIAIAASFMSFGAYADSGGTDTRAVNLAYGGERITQLDSRCIDHYMQKPGVGENKADTKTCAVIQEYVSEIRSLIFSDRVDSEDLRPEIELLYRKGMSAGVLSWIYYSNSDVSDNETVKNAYEAQLAVISSKGAEDADFFINVEGKTAVEGCYTLLFQSIYTEKINRLAREGDSETVKGIILSAPSALGSNYAYDDSLGDGEEGKNYKSFYDTTRANVEIQRNRDKTSSELRAVFVKLYPDYDFDSTALLADFRNSLNTKNLAFDMNNLLSDTLSMLLDGLKREGMEYRNTYLNEKKREVFDAKSNANSAAVVEVCTITPIFSNYDAELCKADVSDFNDHHSDILKKDKVTAKDKGALSDAIAHSDRLSDMAQAALSDKLTLISEKYKAAAVDGVKSYTVKDKAESIRTYATQRIAELINSVPNKGDNGRFALSLLKDRVDALDRKAVTVSELLGTYNKEYLSGVTQFFGEDAKNAIKTAVDEIIDALGGSEEKLKNDAVVKIWRYASLERIFTEAHGNTQVDGIENILATSKSEMENLNEKSDITEYESVKISEIKETIRLDRVRSAWKDIDTLSTSINDGISKYSFVSEALKNSYLSELSAIRSEAYVSVGNAADINEVATLLNSINAKLNDLYLRAEKDETSACLEASKTALRQSVGAQAEYSQKNYTSVCAVRDEYEKKLSEVGTVAEYIVIRDEGLSKIAAIETLVQTAKRVGKDAVFAEYERLLERKICYSAEGLIKLEEIYSRSIFELDQFGKGDTVAKIEAFANDRIALLRGVNLDKLYTSEGIISGEGGFIRPDNYAPDESGYAGAVYSPGGIGSDMELTITASDRKGAEDILKKAAKGKKIFYADGSGVSKDILKKLKSCNVLAAVDIGLGTEIPAADRQYTVSLVIPDGMDISELIGVVFVRDDGSVEFYDATAGDMNIDFTTGHFSKYYIITEGGIDLSALIVCLSIIVICEIIILGMLLVRRRKKREGAEALNGMVPFMLAAKYIPAGGIYIAVALGITALALLAAIAYLAAPDVIDIIRKRAVERMKKPVSSPIPAEVEETPSVLCANREKEALYSPDTPREIVSNTVSEGSEQIDDICEPEEYEEDDEEYEEIEYSSVTPRLSSVSAEEAEQLMSDRDALEGRREEYEDLEIYKGIRRAEINIDTISKMFYAGDTVTLNSLKRKKLVKENVGSVKVLGRGVLDKPLKVVAQDFSASAVKMILLTGGEAIITHSSPERGGERRGNMGR